jgi:two-component system response regulator MprA
MSASGIYSRVSRTTVLFVDSDADSRFVYQSVATAEGFGVELAADGHEAIALANLFLPDVVVLDVRLPELSGLEVARLLRESERTREIPIVIVSAGDTAAVDAAVRATGYEGHLVKPCCVDDLLRLVNVLALGGRVQVPVVRARADAGR